MSTISQNLNDRYNAFIGQARPWDFFSGLGDYMEYAFSQPELKVAIETEIAKRDAEYNEVALLEKQAVVEFREAEKKLLEIIESHELDVATFTPYVSYLPTPPGANMETITGQMRAFEDGRISMGGFHSDRLERFIFDLAANLLHLGYGSEMSEYVVSVEDARRYYARINGPSNSGLVYTGNANGNFIFSKSWAERFRKARFIEKARDQKTWGALEYVLTFWYARSAFLRSENANEILRAYWEDPGYKLGGKGPIDIVYAVDDLDAMAKNHDTNDQVLSFLHVNDFRTRAAKVAGMLLGSLPENNTPEAKRMARARTKALETVREKYWREAVDSFMERVEAFMADYRADQDVRDDIESAEEKWWQEGSRPTYKDGRIILEERGCLIPSEARNRRILCDALFKKMLGEPVHSYEVIHLFLNKSDTGRPGPRAFYDACRVLNTQIYKELKVKKMLEYKANPERVFIREEFFPAGESQVNRK